MTCHINTCSPAILWCIERQIDMDEAHIPHHAWKFDWAVETMANHLLSICEKKTSPSCSLVTEDDSGGTNCGVLRAIILMMMFMMVIVLIMMMMCASQVSLCSPHLVSKPLLAWPQQLSPCYVAFCLKAELLVAWRLAKKVENMESLLISV